MQKDTAVATVWISQQSSTETLTILGINCCEEDSLDKVMPYELSNTDVTVFTISYELKHVEVIKIYTEC